VSFPRNLKIFFFAVRTIAVETMWRSLTPCLSPRPRPKIFLGGGCLVPFVIRPSPRRGSAITRMEYLIRLRNIYTDERSCMCYSF